MNGRIEMDKLDEVWLAKRSGFLRRRRSKGGGA